MSSKTWPRGHVLLAKLKRRDWRKHRGCRTPPIRNAPPHRKCTPPHRKCTPPHRKCTPKPEVHPRTGSATWLWVSAKLRALVSVSTTYRVRSGDIAGVYFHFGFWLSNFSVRKKIRGSHGLRWQKKFQGSSLICQGSHDIWPVSWSWYIIQGGSVTLDSGVNGGLSLVSRWTRLG